MMMIFIISAGLSIILILVNSALAKKIIFDQEKNSPFECGFDPKTSSRLPFSLRFYLISLIFLIFDVEITLILPMPLLTQIGLNWALLVGSAFFIIILILGLFHEWNQGALEWDS